MAHRFNTIGPLAGRYRRWKKEKQKRQRAAQRGQRTLDLRRRIRVLNSWQEVPLTYARCIVFRIRAQEGQYRFKPPSFSPGGKDGKASWRRIWDRSKPQLATLIRRAILLHRGGASEDATFQ